MGKVKTAGEKRAELIIKYRNLAVEKEDKDGDLRTYHLSREGKKIIMHCLNDVKTIGIAYIRELKQIVDNEEAKKGIMVGDGKYTYSAKSSAPKLSVELIPPTLPTFDIFEHNLVSKAHIVSEEEKKRLIEKYHAQPFQYPWMKSSDPIAIILGAEASDVIYLTRKSETAGIAESYRYVV